MKTKAIELAEKLDAYAEEGFGDDSNYPYLGEAADELRRLDKLVRQRDLLLEACKDVVAGGGWISFGEFSISKQELDGVKSAIAECKYKA